MLRSLLYSLTLYSSILFFSVCAILGIAYLGGEESNLYIVAIAGIDALALISSWRLFSRNNQIWKALFLCLIVLLIYFLESPNDKSILKYFMAFSAPALFVGIFASKDGIWTISKWLDIVAIVLSVAAILSIFMSIGSGEILLGGSGSSYQMIAYTSAISFSIIYFFSLFGEIYVDYRFSFTKTKIYLCISILLMLADFYVCISSGGRGGFLLMLFSAIILTYMRIKNFGGAKRVISIAIVLFISVIIGTSLVKPELMERFLEGSIRTFSYISKSGIDMEATSRDYIYTNALKMIDEKPLFGYGLFTYYDKLGGYYSHNYFLEILLEGGFFYLIFVVIFWSSLIKKANRIMKEDSRELLIIPISMFPTIQLQFSGSYMSNAVYWFVIAYLYCRVTEKISDKVS